MSGRTLNVSVLVRLIDKLTGPWRALRRTISSIADVGRKIGIVGAAVSAISFMAPIKAAAAYDATLRDVAITAGLTGAAVEKSIREQGNAYDKLALQVGQRSTKLAQAAQLLVAANMDEGLIRKLMPAIGRVATAANAELNDTAKTALSLSQTLKIPAEQMELALAKLVTAGKLGRFEFKNMASEFPGLTAQIAALGVKGMEAVNHLGAALQVAMKGTDSPSEAANNLKNFLTKIAAPEAIKNFKDELGVDITKVMTSAAAKGINPIEAVIEKMVAKLKVPQKEINKIMKDAKVQNLSDKEVQNRIETLIQGTKVGKLYKDMQVLGFLLPMMQNIKEFKKMKDEIAGATTKVIDDDFASRMRGPTQALERLGELGDQAMRRVGAAFFKTLETYINPGLTRMLAGVEAIDQKYPGLIDKTLTWAGGAILLGGALGVLTLVLSPLGTAIAAIAAALVLATRAIAALSVALLTTPVGWFLIAVAGIGAAAYLIYRNWDQVAEFFKGLWDRVKATFEGVVQWMAEISERMARTIISGFLGLAEAGARLMQPFVDAVKAKLDEALGAARAFVGALNAILGNSPGLTPGQKDLLLQRFQQKNAPAAPGNDNAPGKQGSIGGDKGFAPTKMGAADVNVGGRIIVEAAAGSTVRSVQTENAAVPLAIDRGAFLNRA